MKFGIIGLGRFGYQLAVSLAEQGCEVLAVDRSEKTIHSIRDHVTQAVCIDITDEQSLIEIGIGAVDTVVVATGESFAQSVLITTLLKKHLKIPNVIARTSNQTYETILKLVGADKVLVLERDMGVKFAYQLSLPMANLVPITNNFALAYIKAPKSFVGQTVSKIDCVRRYHISCIAVQKGTNVIPLGQNYVVLENDVLVFAGDKKYLASLMHV